MFERNVTVYCASSNRVDEKYLSAAEELGKKLAEQKIGVVYGGGKVGLMGRLADGALAAGGNVRGIIPKFMMDIELGHRDVTQLEIVEDMHVRQAKMMKYSDAFVTLPGGSGSMVEFLEVISWKRLGLVIAPAILVNFDRYYDSLVEMLNRCIDEKFMAEEYHALWNITSTIDETIDLIISRIPRSKKIFFISNINE